MILRVFYSTKTMSERKPFMTPNAKWEITKKQQLSYINALTAELTSLRAKAGISQSELASLIGISRQTYSAIECNKRIMSWNTYLSLILFFDYNNETHQMIRSIKVFPEELLSIFNNGEKDPYSNANGIAGIPKTITDKLDEQALHAIRTVVMVEYARCANLPGDDVVKAFEGTTIQTLSDIDVKTEQAIQNIKRQNK